MRILLIHNNYGKFSGEESVLDAQKKLIESQGNEVRVYSRSSEDIHGFWSKVNAFFSGFYNYRSVSEIKQFILSFKPEIIHIHNLYPFISPSILVIISRFHIPIVMTVHNYRLVCPNGLFFSHGEICERCSSGNEWNCILRNCEGSMAKSLGYALRNYYARKRRLFSTNISRFICLTSFQKEKLVQNGFSEEKIEVIPNFLEINQPKDIAIPRRKYIAFSGRINRQKGFDLVIDAIKLINLKNDNDKGLPILVAGQIDQNFRSSINVPENIQLLGALRKEQMDEFYRKARFIVFTSRSYEGFPMVFLEAMNHSLPVIAPRLGAYPEIIEDGVNGLLFRPGDYADLADKIKILSTNNDLCLRLGKNGYRKLTEKYSSDIHYKELTLIYKKVIKETSL